MKIKYSRAMMGRFETPMCQACYEGRHWDCGCQTWCECDCDPEAAKIGWCFEDEDGESTQVTPRQLAVPTPGDVRDAAQRAGIAAYYDYLQSLPDKQQDEPWAVTNALLDCVNAALRVGARLDRNE